MIKRGQKRHYQFRNFEVQYKVGDVYKLRGHNLIFQNFQFSSFYRQFQTTLLDRLEIQCIPSQNAVEMQSKCSLTSVKIQECL